MNWMYVSMGFSLLLIWLACLAIDGYNRLKKELDSERRLCLDYQGVAEDYAAARSLVSGQYGRYIEMMKTLGERGSPDAIHITESSLLVIWGGEK